LNHSAEPEKTRKPSIHFSGIGGTAMVAGARLALEAGWEVRGSDFPLYPPTSEMVKALGVETYEGYRAENLDWDPDMVVIGNALSRGNPEVEVSLARRMHFLSLPEWMKDHVLRDRRPVVCCGTHGKTTTTALTAFLLDRAGLGGGWLIGGQPLDFEHSASLGAKGAPFVIEGDEYDTAFFDKRSKFFHYLPEVAVVTSLEFDHGDIFGTLEDIRTAFRLMLRQIPENGWLLGCGDDPEVRDLMETSFGRPATYGFASDATWKGEFGGYEDGFQKVRITRSGKAWGEFRLPMAGRHNLRNAIAALAVAGILEISAAELAEILPLFRGVRRRMEIFLEAKGDLFVSDFAHHPSAMRVTIEAARERWPDRRLVALFEPRSNTTVTNRFQPEITEALAGADEAIIGPIHRAGRTPAEERLDREEVCRHLMQIGKPGMFADDIEEIVEHVARANRGGQVFLIMSNGAFGGLFARLQEELLQES
jgi:UDP-N-acetylmuramate: L-alanyl-gamma-D-glutamyl-meso-diaminopimelate ligase